MKKKGWLLLVVCCAAVAVLAAQAPTSVLNPASDLAGKTLVTAEGDRTITGTFSLTVPIRLATGTTGSPGLVSTTDQTTGLTLGLSSIGLSLNGTQRGLLDASGLTIYGTNIIDNSGKIPGISSTYFASLSGANLTTLNASNISSGTIDAARLPAGVSQVSLLKANSGTDTNASAANVDTYAMASGLTAKDTVLVYVTLEAVTQKTAAPILYNSTDSVTVAELTTGSDLVAGTTAVGDVVTRQGQSANTAVYARSGTWVSTTNYGKAFGATFTTPWTGAWTLALRHGGVTAGGTLKWAWSVYKIAGQ